MPGLVAVVEPLDTASAKFDLSLSLTEQRGSDGQPAGIDGVLEYATDLFDRASVAALAGRLVRLLEAAVAEPERAIGSLDILSAAERHTILREWNDTAHPVSSATLPQLFEAQVTRTPDAVAVVFEDQTLSYGELNARANQLAHHLRDLGVGPEVVVGLCVERSPEMIIGFLGILKAGGAYLPLDPDYPHERLAFMLADAGAPVLVTQSALFARLPADGTRIVRLDATGHYHAASAPTAARRSTAYVIYTSGSTGNPKGFMRRPLRTRFRAGRGWAIRHGSAFGLPRHAFGPRNSLRFTTGVVCPGHGRSHPVPELKHLSQSNELFRRTCCPVGGDLPSTLIMWKEGVTPMVALISHAHS
jgi:non-ribosomal peptide synthetase component F